MSESLFSKKNIKLLSDPMNNSNPITVQVLGICSALAVTAQLKPSVVMAISVIAVMAFQMLLFHFYAIPSPTASGLSFNWW
jgi:Na+-transporting NADH:ubiquinone oxidoreductase subunit D